MTRCQIRDHFGGNEIQKIFYKCIFWANEVPIPYIILYIKMVGFLHGTMIHSTLYPSFSTLQSVDGGYDQRKN